MLISILVTLKSVNNFNELQMDICIVCKELIKIFMLYKFILFFVVSLRSLDKSVMCLSTLAN